MVSVAAALSSAKIAFVANAPLHKRVWWRTGGPADIWLVVPDLPTLQRVLALAHEHRAPVTVVGNGSNILVSDRGIRGITLQLGTGFTESQAEGGLLRVGAGLKLTVLLSRAKAQQWTGVTCFAGIPGTVGGAIRMNAGSSLGETGDHLFDVTFVSREGCLETWEKERLQLTYRTCRLPGGAVVASARFQMPKISFEEEQARIQTFIERRKATQPLDFPSCGSTFRNPTGDAAGRLIEAAGLKGFRIGDAQISAKHANFILNLGSATASDLRNVIQHAQTTVHAQFGIELEPEVHFVGEW